MAVEKFITGKHDSGRHDGRYANVKREQAADFELQDFLQSDVIFEDNHTRHQDNLNHLHGVYYKGTFYWHGVGQKGKEDL